ncbi:hypothetical protein J7E25_05630 [Agromyces sp. ISL-38]|uniref:hypothetical protein n=1 Tax=Agromyces sp. ISL-38 TaxID=2819107 RepID=UPI001BE7F398|nr:hypothetical protein [Agromyces sp. ISL-38]MBT2498569.1 hypothetical protein [Agromyces sp. ISL-38]
MRRATARKRREADTRAKARVRVRVWREEHPDRVREYQQQWVEGNRDKVREYYNRYYHSHQAEVSARAAARRDADPERAKAAQRAWAKKHKDRRAELQRARRADPEVYAAELEANAAARRLKRALARAGMPPKLLHPSTAAERRANERAAGEFFEDERLPERLRQSAAFAQSLTKHMFKHHARMREFAVSYIATRDRMGLPPVQVDDVVWARAVEIVLDSSRRVDLITSRDVAAAVRSAKAAIRREERQRQYDQLVKALGAHMRRHRARLAVEAGVEVRARARRGKPRVTLDVIAVQVGLEEVAENMRTDGLTKDDVRRAMASVYRQSQAPAETADEAEDQGLSASWKPVASDISRHRPAIGSRW